MHVEALWPLGWLPVALVGSALARPPAWAQPPEYAALSPANCHDVVRELGRMVDQIDATQDLPPSRFKENQSSRVVDSPIGRVREFGPEDRAGISYLLHIANPGSPHVVRVYYPDCAESCMQVGVMDPTGIGWQFQVHTGGE